MGRQYESIDDKLKDFFESAPVFFVATAPSGEGGFINLSPKGLDSFRVISPNQVAYLDLTGSGIETIAHIKDNGRITFMFSAFSGKPLIMRLYGKGSVVLPGSSEFGELAAHFPKYSGIRSIIKVDVSRISSSCGFGVPLMDFVGHRKELTDWSERKGEEGIAKYQEKENQKSIDGLPGLEPREMSEPSGMSDTGEPSEASELSGGKN